jgi:hypothetical protein
MTVAAEDARLGDQVLCRVDLGEPGSGAAAGVVHGADAAATVALPTPSPAGGMELSAVAARTRDHPAGLTLSARTVSLGTS